MPRSRQETHKTDAGRESDPHWPAGADKKSGANAVVWLCIAALITLLIYLLYLAVARL